MTTPTITELYAQIGAMMANWQRFLDQQMGWQVGPSSANDLAPPDNDPLKKGYRVMVDAAGNKRQIMTPAQMEKLVADAVKQIDDLNPAALGAQFTQVRANFDEITASLSSSRAELTALVDSATSSKNAAASSATAASSSKTAAASSATAAASSATAASSSKTAAASSATAAAASQGVATTKASESQASAAASANKAADAAVSASIASTKAGEASASASTASTKASEAASSATSAASSATAASSSATAAAGSATAAKTSETNANTKASAAATSAVSAQKWADNAVDSAVTTGKFSALHHATKASESATAAAASANTSLAKASEASGHASSASTSASAATTKASEAAAGASTATARATAAASSATSAASSATSAGNSATAAANSATAAANSAAAASSSKTAAASSAADAAASAQVAREAMYVSTGALIEAGEVNMSSGAYPTPLTAADKDLACFWKVTTAGISSLDGVDYEVGDTLVYSSSLKKFYKIDNTESVQSVNGMKGAVRLTAADVGALGSGATAVAAAKLATARTISITGDGTGSASFDGTGNVSISLAVTDDSHAHTFANLKNRPTTLAGYGITDAAASGHVHADLFQKAGGVITGLTQINVASGPTIGGATFDNGWLRVGTSAGGIAIDPNEIMASGHELLLGSITSHGIGLMVGNVKAGAVKADGLYSMNSKVLTEAAGSAVSAGKLATARALALTGDATGSLTFDGSADASMAVTLANSGVTAGTFTKVTVDAKGRVTAATTQTAADIPALDWSKITSGKPTNLTGYGISSATLKAIEGLAMAADKAVYFTAAGTAAAMTVTGAARALLDDADSAAMRATLGAASTSAATTTANGLMSAADKAKLDSVQASANAYVHPASGVVAGSYRSVTVDGNGHVTGGSNPTTLNDYGITDAAPSSHVGAGGTAHELASPTMAGFMSPSDKAKLDGIASGANSYVHPTSDGSNHVPATGTTSNGKVLKAGATAGSFSWASLTPGDVGLSNVKNWPFSTTTNDPSDTTYATAGAVKRAADIANAALPKAGGSLTGSVTFTNDSVLQWSRNTDAAAIGFKNSADSDVDSFMWFRASDNGNEYFKWQTVSGTTTTDLMTLKGDNLRIKGDQVYHQGFKPTPADIGAAVASIFQGEGYKLLGSTHLLVDSEYKFRWYKVCEWDLAASRIDQTYEIDVHGDTNYSGSTGRVRVNVSRFERDPQGRLHVVVTPVHGNQRAACVYVTFDNNKTVVWVKSAYMWGSVYAQVIGSPNEALTRPKEELTGAFVVDGDAQISDARRLLCHHAWDGDTNTIKALAFDGGELFDSGNRVYSASSRPTLRDINGGTFSGIFKTDVDGPIAFVAERAGYRAAMGNSVVAGEYIFGGMAVSASDFQHYIRLGNNKFQYHQNGSNFDVYHTGNKPTAVDVGALPVNANAVSAAKLATARTFTFTGDSTGSASFDGTANVTINLVGKASGVAAGTYRSVTVDTMGYVTAGTNPTTLAGYGITDALGISANAVSASKLATARTINGTNFDGTANITTANWGTARTLTIGGTGKSVNGSGNVDWSLDEIGAAPSGHGIGETGPLKADANAIGNSSGIYASVGDLGVNFYNKYGPLLQMWRSGGADSTGQMFQLQEAAGTLAFRTRSMNNWVDWVKVYTDQNKPTSTDVGLGNVNNWAASGAVNLASDTTYATAGAVKKAYDLAAAALPSSKADVFKSAGMLTDLNVAAAAKPGFFQYGPGAVGAPMSGYGHGLVVSTGGNPGSGNWYQQIAFGHDAKIYTRRGVNSAATGAWARIYTTEDKPSLAELGAAAADHTHSLRDIKDSPYKEGCDCATTANLSAAYVNGSSGVGATLTNNSTLAALTIDGVTCSAGMRVLVKNQTAAAQNGIYTVTNAGSASEAWVLTRTPGCDTSAEAAGAVVTVDQGTANGGLLATTEFKRNGVIGATAMNWRVVVDGGNIGAQHHNSGATAGTYRSVTVNAQGHVTAGTNPTTLAGYGITDALGLNANAVSASKLATARTLTVGGTGKAFDGTANLSWSLAEIGALPAAGGGIAGDFWRAAGDRQFGLVDHLGSSTDAKACLVLLAKKYVGTLLNKTGFVGRILFSRGSAASFNYTDFVDVSVATAYNANLVSLQRRSGVTVAAAKIVEVTYNSEVYFALYRPVASDSEVVATGHAFNAALPLLIPDATAYTITDVVTNEEDYHVGNKPTAKDLNVVDRSGDTMTGDLVNSRRFIITDANGSSSQFEARNGDMMAIFRTSGGGAILGAQTGGEWDGYIKVGKDAGFSYTPKGGSTEFQVYHQGFKPTPADVGALASGGTAVNAGGVKQTYQWSTPEHDFNDGGNTGQDLKFYWHGSANVNGPTDGSGAKTSGYGITYGNGVHGGQFELGYGSWPQFRSLINGNWSGWNKLYHTGFKPTPADVGALPVNANAVSATKLATARTINGTNFDGTANITTANWGAVRTLTIGKTGKSVNGSADVAWSLNDIGAVSKAGDVMDGNLDAPKFTSQGVEFFGDGAWAMIKATGKEGVILHVDTAQQARVKVGTNGSVPIYHALNKPSSDDVGLGSVNNWAASSAVNLASDTTYATAGAVKKAYDLAAAALPAGSNAVSATKLATARTISTTGDATGSASFDGTANAAIALTLANSGVTAGTYGKVTVDAKGRVTAGLAMVAADIPSLDWSKISSGKPTTLAGYGITDAQAKHANLTALAGFTPAADRIPYFTSASAASVTPLTAFARSLLDDNDAAAARATLGVLSIEEPFKSAADVATTANLAATYANGSSGVGATLTSSAAAALVLDGVTCSVGMRVLVKNQTAAAQNGVYTVTNAGSSTVAWVLTRATDADTTAKLAGAVVTVDQGASNGSMLLTNDWKKTSVVGTTAMSWRVVIDSGNVGSYHHNSGATAGTYRSVTVNAQGHVTAGTNPTTLSGYGITDAAPSSHVGAGGGAHAVATSSLHGFMSSTDKAKLDSIASNANNYAHPAGDGNLHVPATGTSNNGKYLMAGATAGSLSWQSIDAAGVGAVPVAGGAMSGVLTVNNEIRTTSANSLRMVYGNYGTFWRQDGSNMYLMFTNAGDQNGSYNSLRPMYANLTTGNVNFGHAVDVAGNLSVNTGSTTWLDMRASAAFQGRSAVATASASAIVRQEHADRHFILGGLGNSCFGVFMINKSRTVNGTDAGAYLSADGTWYCGANVSANDYQVRSDRRLKSDFKEIKDAWGLWKTLQISEYTKQGVREYGFIAQDFEKNHKPAVAMTSTSEYLNLKPMSVLAIAGKVIQSLQDRVENLESLLRECMKRMEVGDASTS